MDSAKKIHATLGVFVLRLFPTMIQMILKDNITPGKLHRMFINKTLNTVLTDADIDLMKMLPNMDNFTIDLCYKILRFENLIDEPKCKWGNSPHDTDVEISDDIQRILNFSNEIVSKSSVEITKIVPTTFEENVKRIIERVDGYLKGDNCHQLYKNLHIQHIDTSELLNILEHLLQKHPITVIPSILKTDGKTMMRELYSRIAIVITDIFPDILRELILSRITPQNLYKSFDNAFLSSCYLKQQTDLKTSNLTNSFSCLDIPLIYKLLRYFSLIASPSKGWGKDPHPTDLLIADDVERIRMFRNEIAHRCDANINKNDFDAYFVTFSEIVERIDNHLTGQNSYKQNVIYCKTCVMDTQMQTQYENAAKQLENLKLHYERKPVKFYWGDSFEQSLMDLRMMIQNKELEDDEKFRVQIVMQIESDTNNRTVNILNSLRDEINGALKGIDFVFAFTGSVVLCVDILVEEMETDEKLYLLLFSFMIIIIQTEGIRVPSTEYVNVVLTHSEENTFFDIAKKKTTSSVVYLDFDIDASHFETDKKMEDALSDIVENVYMKSNGNGTCGIKGDIKATVLPFEFDSNTDITISEQEVGQSIKENINTKGDPENSEVLVKYEKEEQLLSEISELEERGNEDILEDTNKNITNKRAVNSPPCSSPSSINNRDLQTSSFSHRSHSLPTTALFHPGSRILYHDGSFSRYDDQLSVNSFNSSNLSISEHPLRPKSPNPNVTIVRRNSNISLPSSPTNEVMFDMGRKPLESAHRQYDSIDDGKIMNCNNSNHYASGDVPTHRPNTLSAIDLEKLASLVQNDITSSNSNDSGIQHDVSVHSSNESLKS